MRCRLSNAGLTVALEGTLALPSRIPADPKTYPSSLTLADRTAGGVRVSVRAAPRMHVVRCWHVVVAPPAAPPELYADLARVEPAGKGAVASRYSATARALPHLHWDWAQPCYMGRGSPLATSALGGATLLRTCCVAVVAMLRADSTLMTTCMLSGAWWMLSCCLLMIARWGLNLAVRRAERPLLRLVSRSQSTMFAPCLVAAHAARCIATCDGPRLGSVACCTEHAACCRL